jgi:predicted RecB family nuclease
LSHFRLPNYNDLSNKMVTKKTLRTCKNGHQYYKSSDCPTCPICEEAKKPNDGFLSLLYAPARRALENADIRTLKQLSAHSEQEILKLHGIGKTAIPVLKKLLRKQDLHLKIDKDTALNSV